MYIEQFYTPGIAQYAYYIESGGEAAVIDPMRDAKPYAELSKRRGVRMKYIFETHFHADFVSGHQDLALITGAKIIYGPGAQPAYDITSAGDGAEFILGFIKIKVLHTPGHTPESSCYLLLDERSIPHSVFTGDTLFVGDVGRPDLAVNAAHTLQDQAGLLYDSIENKLLQLPNYVVVYPGHGAGSACGKSIGTESHSTVGLQKQSNYALKAPGKEAFINVVTEGLNDIPSYFAFVAALNKQGSKNLDEILERSFKPVSVKVLKTLLANKSVTVIDTRTSIQFASGYIPGSIYLGLDGPMEGTAARLLEPGEKIIVISEPGREIESISSLARVGLEQVTGYLEGGFQSWLQQLEPVETISVISAVEFEERFRYNSCTVVDVREPSEWIPGFVAGAKLMELSKLEKRVDEIDRNKICYIYCFTGYRSMIAASLLKRRGFTKVVNVNGGMNNIQKTPISIKQLTHVT